MSAAVCVACGKPKNAAAAVCPHCGARRAAAGASLAGAQLSPAEVQALLAISTPPSLRPTRSLAEWMVPHPALGGVARGVELALTVVAAPLLVIALVMMVRRGWRERMRNLEGEVLPALLVAMFATLPLNLLLSLLGLGWRAQLWVGAVAASGLLLRAGLRKLALSRRARCTNRFVA